MWIIQNDLTHMPEGWQTLGRLIRVTKPHVCLSFWRLAQTSVCGGGCRVSSKAERTVKAKSARAFQASACFRGANAQLAKASLTANLGSSSQQEDMKLHSNGKDGEVKNL